MNRREPRCEPPRSVGNMVPSLSAITGLWFTVPMAEPEVLIDGEHPLEGCFGVTAEVLRTVFSQIYTKRVALEGMILKPNMVLRERIVSSKAVWMRWPTPR
jgi:fructose-bisphosphate aldolase class 1